MIGCGERKAAHVVAWSSWVGKGGKEKGGGGRASAKSLATYSKITSNGMFGSADLLVSSVLQKLKKPEKDTCLPCNSSYSATS